MSLDTRFLQESRKIAFQSLNGLGGLTASAGQKTTSVLNEAFGQIFADIQKTDLTSPLKTPAPADTSPKPEAPKAAETIEKDKSSVKEADRKDRNDDDRHDMKVSDKDDKKCDTDKDDKKIDGKDSSDKKDVTKSAHQDDKGKDDVAVTDTQAQTADAPTGNDIDLSAHDSVHGKASEHADAEAKASDTGDNINSGAKAALASNAPAQATPVAIPVAVQQAAPAPLTTPKGDAGADQSPHQEEQSLIPVSFRPDTPAGADPAGKNRKDERASAINNNAGTPVVGNATPAAIDPSQKSVQANGTQSGEKFQNALNLMQQMGGDTQAQTLPKDQAGTQSFSAIANAQAQIHSDTKQTLRQQDVKEAVQDNSQQQVSLPAAGTRVIAPMGSTTPSSNGLSGGGTPPSTPQVARTESAAGPNGITMINGLHSAAEGGPISFVKTVRDGLPASQLSPAEQVAVQLNKSAKTGNDRFNIQLNPADLGRVDVRMDIAKDGSVRVHVTADNAATFDMLQKDSRSLERALQQAGLQADSGSLSFSLRDGAQNQFAQRQTYGNPFAQQGGQSYGAKPQGINDIAVPTYQLQVAQGRVDVRV